MFRFVFMIWVGTSRLLKSHPQLLNIHTDNVLLDLVYPSALQDKESKIADPKFKSVETRDFHLLPDSPAHSLGITPIDIETVGPQSNPFTLHNMPAWTPLEPLKKKTKA